MTTDHEIIDEALYRAILHGVAAGACRVAARETRSAHWAMMAGVQSEKARVKLHQAAAAGACDLTIATSRFSDPASTPVSRSKASATGKLGSSKPRSIRL